MKILCMCDYVVNLETMAPIKALERFGAEVVFMKDEDIQTLDAMFEAMFRAEKHGADACPTYPPLLDAVKDVDILVVHTTAANTEVLNAAANLKYMAVLRGGIENVQDAVCKERGIKIINAASRSAHAVADFTVGMMIAEMKNIARGHKALTEGKWRKDYVNLYNIHNLRTRTVGIIGGGQIGQRVIDRLKGFGCKIIVHDPFVPDEELAKLGYTPVSLETLLQQSDFVSIHLRLSEKTHKFITKRELDMMKKTAIFINTSRGGLINEDDLVQALQERTIGGAALDVFYDEPIGMDNPLLKLDNVTLTPHLAGTSNDTFADSVEIITDELTKLFESGALAK